MPNFFSSSETDNHPISCGSQPLGRAFCFGCDEGRHGTVLKKKVTLQYIPKVYQECICDGCETVLSLFRPFLPPFVQLESHEGQIVWGFPNWFYNGRLKQYPRLHTDSLYSDSYLTAITFTDGGDAEDVLGILLYEGTRRNLSKFRGNAQ